MDGIEFDLRLCRSGEVVIAHDATVARITGRRAPIRAYSYQELRELDVGSYFAPEFKGEKIPLFEEVIERFSEKLLFDLELKGKSIHTDGLEEKVVSLIHKYNLQERVIISSFNPMILLRIRTLDPSIKIGLNFLDDGWHWLRKLWYLPLSYPYSVHPTPFLIDDYVLNLVGEQKALLIPWMVNEESQMLKLFEQGVDGIISDYPSLLKSEYNKWREESTSTGEKNQKNEGTKHSPEIF